jgi:N-methylhydantoinase A
MAAWRYEHQGFELTVDWPARSVNAQTLESAIAAFHREHERLYTFAQTDTPVELVQLRVQAVGSVVKPSLPKVSGSSSAAQAQVGEQSVWTNDGWTLSPVYERDALGLGATMMGPAIVQQLDATTYILPGQQGSVDAYGNIVIVERQ